MLGISVIGQFAIGQLGPVINPPLVNGVRLPLYTAATPQPTYPANYWNGVPTGYPGN